MLVCILGGKRAPCAEHDACRVPVPVDNTATKFPILTQITSMWWGPIGGCVRFATEGVSEANGQHSSRFWRSGVELGRYFGSDPRSPRGLTNATVPQLLPGPVLAPSRE